MAQKLIPDVLELKRTQPVQGKPVDVIVTWNGLMAGSLHLPFAAWIKLNRLLGHGVEVDKKEDRKLNIRVKVEGLDAGDTVEELIPQKTAVQRPAPVPYPYRGGISNLAADDEADEDIKVAEQQARIDAAEQQIRESQEKQQEQLVRSLRPTEGGESDG